MVNIDKKMSEVLDRGLLPYPGTADRYWNMGVIHQESVKLVNTLLDDLLELVKRDYNLEFNVKEFKDKYYEGIT